MFAKSFIAMAGAASLMTANAQVTATGTMGTTNPPAATLGTAVNQTSYSRLLSANAIDDFCIFAPPETGVTIGDSEAYEVAWCVQPRNNARVIPDGVLQAVHFVRTPMYVQVQGWGDFTKLNIASGDEGGELDPHGSTGLGNPVGGNVTANVTGSDVSYEEWMNYMSYQQFCLRICTNQESNVTAALQCQHTLDEMGCEWVMPGDYTNGTFTDCEADAAYPPGIYPQADGSTSTFAQRYTNSDSVGGTWTIGATVTPSSAYSIPASSMCTTYSTVSNGIASLALADASKTAAASTSAASSASKSGSTTKASTGTAAATTTKASTSAATSATSAASSGAGISSYSFNGVGSTLVTGFVSFAVVAGAGAFFL